jgi:hypothetical protein
MYISQGLGNQLFHYCYLSYLIKLRPEIKIRIVFNRNPVSNHYLFQLTDLVKSNNSVLSVRLNNGFIYRIRVILSKSFRYKLDRIFRIFREKDLFIFEEELLQIPRKSIVFGSFINTKYVDPIFLEVQDKIMTWLSSQPRVKNYHFIEFKDTVVLHLRKSEEHIWKNVRGTLTENYYKEAIDLIAQRQGVKLNKIFVFTDDVVLAKKTLPTLPVTHWFGPSDASNLQTLYVFANSYNFVGSNSTLSWWGAKLNNHPKDSTKILPRPWVLNQPHADLALKIPSVDYIKIL